MTVVMVLTVLILLSSCSLEDVEYAGKVLEGVQSNVTDTTALPPFCGLPTTKVENIKIPQTTPSINRTFRSPILKLTLRDAVAVVTL